MTAPACACGGADRVVAPIKQIAFSDEAQMRKKSTVMNYHQRVLFTIIAILAAVMSACANDDGGATTSEEESGAELGLDESYDAVRNGAWLILTYDLQGNSFNGSVENTTDNTLRQVRVEVHLSNGVELGPTTPTDLNPGESMDVSLAATNKDFDGWTAHPEVGESRDSENGHGEGDNEHGEEGENGHTEGDSD